MADSPLSPTTPPLDEQAGRFHLVGEIGHGGMGVVLRGHDPALHRDLAIKMLLERHRGRPDLERRFLEEAQVAGQLQHPGIVPVHELGRLDDGRPFFAMKLVQGVTLARLLRERSDPTQDLSRFLGIFQQVCQTVAYAHANKVLHRDLKPDNVMVGAFGEVQVMDWGLAKRLQIAEVRLQNSQAENASSSLLQSDFCNLQSSQTQPGAILGTWAYMAPEQARGEVDTLDERCDVFGLGAVLCEILTGLPPYAGPTAAVVQDLARRADLEAALAWLDGCGADAELIALAQQCLSADPVGRPRDAGVVAATVSQYLTGVQERLHRAELERAAAQARATAERRARRLTIWLALAGLLLVLGGGVAALWGLQIHRDRQAEAEAAVRAVEADLEMADLLRRQQKWGEALAVVGRNESRLSGSVGEELRRRVRTVQTELTLVRRLEQVRWDRAELDGVGINYAGTDRAYAEAFRTLFDLDLAVVDPDEAARRLGASSVRDPLRAALDDWAFVKGSLDDGVGRKRLLTVAARADSTDHWGARFRAALAADDLESVRQAARQAPIEDLPPATVILLARGLLEGGESGVAISLLEQGRRRHPADFWLNMEVAHFHYYARPPRPDEAVRYYSVALAMRPNSATVCNDLGNALHLQGKLPEAEAAFREAVRLRPSFSFAHANLSIMLRLQDRPLEAEAAAREALRLAPGFASAHYNLGLALRRQGRRTEAEAAYRKALELDSRDPRYHYHLGLILYEQDRSEEAETPLRASLRLVDRHSLSHRQLGNVLLDLGRRDEAAASYARAVQLDPNDAEARLALGRVLLRLGRVRDGLTALRQGHDLTWKQPGTRRPAVAEEVKAARLLQLEDQLPRLLSGERQPADAAEQLAVARLCLFKRLPAASARFYSAAFATAPTLDAEESLFALTAAALAVAGRGDAADLDRAKRARLRQQAFAWLSDDLARCKSKVGAATEKRRVVIRRQLRQYLSDPDLSALRDLSALEQLPEDERTQWRKLWENVAELLKRMQTGP